MCKRVFPLPEQENRSYLNAQRIMIEVRPDGQVSIGAARRIQLLLQPLSIENLHQRLRVCSVVLQPLLDVAERLRMQHFRAEALSFRVEEIHHQFQRGMEAIVEHRRDFFAVSATIHLIVQLR